MDTLAFVFIVIHILKVLVFFKQLEHVSASSAELLRVPGPNPIMSQSSGLGSGFGAGN